MPSIDTSSTRVSSTTASSTGSFCSTGPPRVGVGGRTVGRRPRLRQGPVGKSVRSEGQAPAPSGGDVGIDRAAAERPIASCIRSAMARGAGRPAPPPSERCARICNVDATPEFLWCCRDIEAGREPPGHARPLRKTKIVLGEVEPDGHLARGTPRRHGCGEGFPLLPARDHLRVGCPGRGGAHQSPPRRPACAS